MTLTDKESYEAVLKNNNMTEEQVQTQVQKDDVTETLPNMYLKDSSIHGTGLFTKRRVLKGNIVCPARIRNMRTPAGRYGNHAANPNAFSRLIGDSFVLIAYRDIQKDEEVTVDYQQVINENRKVTQ